MILSLLDTSLLKDGRRSVHFLYLVICWIFFIRKDLKDFPQINFIGHGPSIWKRISDNETDSKHLVCPNGPVIKEGLTCKLLEKYPNLYGNISAFSGYNALPRDPEFARKFLLKFSNKILHVTDNTSLKQEELINSLSLDINNNKKKFWRKCEFSTLIQYKRTTLSYKLGLKWLL